MLLFYKRNSFSSDMANDYGVFSRWIEEDNYQPGWSLYSSLFFCRERALVGVCIPKNPDLALHWVHRQGTHPITLPDWLLRHICKTKENEKLKKWRAMKNNYASAKETFCFGQSVLLGYFTTRPSFKFLSDFEKMVYWLDYRPKYPKIADFCYFGIISMR